MFVCVRTMMRVVVSRCRGVEGIDLGHAVAAGKVGSLESTRAVAENDTRKLRTRTPPSLSARISPALSRSTNHSNAPTFGAHFRRNNASWVKGSRVLGDGWWRDWEG